jgi:sugar O-acyltransferase (sialic acid O-acetyltransferase NeuD family)
MSAAPRTRVVIIGGGGHGTVVADILLRLRDAGRPIEPVAFVDDRAAVAAILDLPVLDGGLAALGAIDFDAAIVAIGDNATRRHKSAELRRSGVPLAIACHPSSVVAADAVIGLGVVICAGAVVNSASRLGEGAIINTLASVDHHNSIGDFAHVAPGAHLGGAAWIGDDALIGIGATVAPQRRVGARATVGAGAVVVHDVPEDAVAVGVPARVRRAAPSIIRPVARAAVTRIS